MIRVMLYAKLLSPFYPHKCDMAFKSQLNFYPLVILKACYIWEDKRGIVVIYSITYMIILSMQ